MFIVLIVRCKAFVVFSLLLPYLLCCTNGTQCCCCLVIAFGELIRLRSRLGYMNTQLLHWILTLIAAIYGLRPLVYDCICGYNSYGGYCVIVATYLRCSVCLWATEVIVFSLTVPLGLIIADSIKLNRLCFLYSFNWRLTAFGLWATYLRL